MSSSTNNYIEDYLPPSVVEQLQAGAFRSVCNHLKERSDEVQNIEMMTVTGFCRNCLAKWMVVEARRLAKDESTSADIVGALNAMGYDEAAQYVYGCDYKDWKKQHAKKASDEQMQRYNDSAPLHAKHDKELLATKGDKPLRPVEKTTIASSSSTASKPSLLSNVCCEDLDESSSTAKTVPASNTNKASRTVPPFTPPPAPTGGPDTIGIAILTVSDRASRNEYASGDLSGPAVQEAVNQTVASLDSPTTPVTCVTKETAIVPDNVTGIQSKLKDMASNGEIHIIFTTGGTGFSPRDVTPEATVGVLDQECRGLLSFCATELSAQQPLASLSRGTAGIRNKTLIVNLPGNPKGVAEIIPILLPLLLHGVADMQD